MKLMVVGVFVVLAATLFFCDALMPMKLMIKRVKEAREAVTSLSRIVKRQSSQCVADFGRLTGDQKFQTCEQIAEEFEDNDQLSPATVDNYCNQGCGTYLLYWYKILAKDCDYFDNPDTRLEEYIEQSCDHGPNDVRCLILWDEARNGSTFYPTTYEQCIQQFDPSVQTCPNSCLRAEHWIDGTFGCCYRALLDYEEYDEYIEDYFGEKYWLYCDLTEPKKCTS